MGFHRLIALIILMLTCLPMASADTSSLWSLPLKLEDDRLSIEVEWGGETISATLDSAATFPLIEAAALAKIQGQRLDQTIEIFGVAGLETYAVGKTGPLSIGPSTLFEIQAAINNAPNQQISRAVLPLSLIEGRTLDFRFEERRLDVYNFSPREERRTVRSRLDYELIQGVPFIPVKVNGIVGLALVDTGSDVTYINPAFARAAGASFLPDKTLEIFGTGPDASPVRVMRVKRLDLGDHRKEKFEILSANTPVFEYVGRRDLPTMVLGMDTLGALRLQIDRQKQEIILSRRESRAEGHRYEITPMSGRIKRKR